jgi:endoglucanase
MDLHLHEKRVLTTGFSQGTGLAVGTLSVLQRWHYFLPGGIGMRFTNVHRLLSAALMLVVAVPLAHTQSSEPRRGEVTVQDRRLMRDGRPWIPHGFYQIAFEVAPGNLSRADHPFWATAHDHYTPAEYQNMVAAGADTVRIQVAQAAADPQSPLYDRSFVQEALSAVRSARETGLTVILCVQDESHVPGEQAIDLPDDGTRRVWRELSPSFRNDRGVIYELLNEPRPPANKENWRRWEVAMTLTLNVVRQSGAPNVIIADGLGVGQTLDGAPLLPDPQLAYSSHPYALQAHGQSSQAWNEKFGNFARRAPVMITEWHFGGYFCDENTPAATVAFLQYINQRSIGVVAGTWDWAPAGFGNARWGFPAGKFSSFVNRTCHQPGYGLGQVIETWYKTGIPATTVQ